MFIFFEEIDYNSSKRDNLFTIKIIFINIFKYIAEINREKNTYVVWWLLRLLLVKVMLLLRAVSSSPSDSEPESRQTRFSLSRCDRRNDPPLVLYPRRRRWDPFLLQDSGEPPPLPLRSRLRWEKGNKVSSVWLLLLHKLIINSLVIVEDSFCWMERRKWKYFSGTASRSLLQRYPATKG